MPIARRGFSGFKFVFDGSEFIAMTALSWLPSISDWRPQLAVLRGDPAGAWQRGVALANTRLDFVRTNGLDQAVFSALEGAIPGGLSAKPIRLAILGSATFAHLHAGIRVAGMRRNLHISIYENDFGQYIQELTDLDSALHAFQPNAVLLALDSVDLTAGLNAAMHPEEADAALAAVLDRIKECWRLARNAFHCPVIHQAALPVFPGLLGNNEHRLPGSREAFLERLNHSLRPMADAEGVEILGLDIRATRDGIGAWHDPSLWHRAKQEVTLAASPMYGDLLVRILAAKLGRSYKCLVMDLDHTLWGGVVGDDGLEGLVIGQGSALGEAFVAFQEYAKELCRRGIILAVCSKNDEANALEPFDKHPEMILKRGDIACFVANWNDKASNIRAIAEQLNIGIDSLVFVDDNPFERALVRQELPMVAVPEVGDDPTYYAQFLADAGYFEGLSITDDDRARSGQYQGNVQRQALRASVTDLPAYLRSLEMELVWRRFDTIGLQRVVQLINKTNQFNLTTRRYTDEDIRAVMADPRAFGLQLRLADRFGDNGIISIIIGKLDEADDLQIDTWLMSCRVLGRQVEPTTLNLIAAEAQRIGGKRLVGTYLPTKKNGMVKDHYERLGFTKVSSEPSGENVNILDLAEFVPLDTFIDVKES
jgi:FkbH-like protein